MYDRSSLTRRSSSVFTAAFAAAALAACSGGGGGGPSTPPTQAPAPAPVPTPTQTPNLLQPPSPAAANGYALFYFTLSGTSAPNAHVRRPDFAAPNAQSVKIVATGPSAPTGGSGTPVTGTTQITTFAPGQPNCQTQAAGLVCYAYVQVPVGSGYSFALFLQANGSTLSQANTGTTTITSAGSSTAIDLQFNPVVAAISLALGSSTVARGTPTNVPLAIVLKDAAGNDLSKDPSGKPVASGTPGDAIFAGSVTLASSDPVHAPVSKTRVNRPSDLSGVTVNYDGSATGPYTISASISSATTATATLTPQ